MTISLQKPQKQSKTANRLLWTAQILLCLLFLFAGSMKFIMPAEKMQGPIAFPIGFIHFIGIMEMLGALGLVLPGLLRVHTELTSIAASGLVIIMAGATSTTIIGMGVGPAVFPLVVGLIAAIIAVARWTAVPVGRRNDLIAGTPSHSALRTAH
jgi:hypothetical protein